jgi:hypothetical protein
MNAGPPYDEMCSAHNVLYMNTTRTRGRTMKVHLHVQYTGLNGPEEVVMCLGSRGDCTELQEMKAGGLGGPEGLQVDVHHVVLRRHEHVRPHVRPRFTYFNISGTI